MERTDVVPRLALSLGRHGAGVHNDDVGFRGLCDDGVVDRRQLPS